jgi:hypothetical protein
MKFERFCKRLAYWSSQACRQAASDRSHVLTHRLLPNWSGSPSAAFSSAQHADLTQLAQSLSLLVTVHALQLSHANLCESQGVSSSEPRSLGYPVA